MTALGQLHSDDFDGVFMTSTQIFDYYNFLHKKTRILRTKETIQMIAYSIFTAKQSCLTKPLNHQIAKLTSNGLITVWNNGFRKNTARKNQFNDSGEPKRLAIDQINGLITICMVLYTICVIIFILELMSARHESIKIIMDFFSFDGTKLI